VRYAAVLGVARYTVHLVPGVLGELDELKMKHQNPAVREKALKFTKRVKGWLKQGRLADRVRVEAEVWVSVAAAEPDFAKTLSWLTPEIVDDRIIASVLEAQRRYPSDRMVLLSGDAIMLAKAAQANIPTEDTPDPEV
jgi:predicted ribonuclease YlaK